MYLASQRLDRHADMLKLIPQPQRSHFIESALAEPRPGWIRGFRMAEPMPLASVDASALFMTLSCAVDNRF